MAVRPILVKLLELSDRVVGVELEQGFDLVVDVPSFLLDQRARFSHLYVE